MRDIRFRAWDNEGNEYSNELIGMVSMQEWYKRYNYPMPMPYKNRRYNFMQFTGLTDKNGKDIYEGDIISSKPYMPQNDSERYISQVIFRTDLSRWSVEGVREWLGEYDHLYEAIKPPHETEVIGNIYENPELLTTP